jgi:hypothetical protein
VPTIIVFLNRLHRRGVKKSEYQTQEDNIPQTVFSDPESFVVVNLVARSHIIIIIIARGYKVKLFFLVRGN